jgi:L-Ala-D/L-Glu epimerase / N-acetyl-D-glutamate racemase
MKLEIRIETWSLATPFRITGYVMNDVQVVVITLRDGEFAGSGEAVGVYYRRDTAAALAGQIEAVRARIEAGIDREALRAVLPAGGARNAVDCALWDLEAKRTGHDVHQLAGLEGTPRPLLTTCTLGAAEPATMAQGARNYAGARAFKLKLTGESVDAERVRAVRAARPDVWMGVDANQGFTRKSLGELLPVLLESRVALIEQPFPIGKDDLLDGLSSPIPVAADESCQDLADVAGLAGRYDVVNIKLDKCGGLTEALEMARRARQLGLKVMVGNMLGTSLAMAPAFVVGQLCDVVDLDGPLLLARDRSPAATYENGHIWCAPAIWGGGRKPR